MATIVGGLNGGGPYQLELVITQTSQSISGNYSNISYTLRVRRTSNAGYRSWGNTNYTLVINGSTLASGASWYMDFPAGGPTTRNIRSGTMKINHNADGTKTVAASAALDTSSSAVGDGSLSGSVGLTTIPRASQPTVSPTTVNAGSSVTIATNRASSSFTHTLTYSFQGQSGTIATKTTNANPTWTPPLSLLNYITDRTSATCTITCETFSGSTSLGTKSVNLVIAAGPEIVPTANAVTHSDSVSAIASAIGAYVQGYSKLNVSTSGSSVYGATIEEYLISVDGVSLASNSGVLPAPLPSSGSRTLSSTVTDSRGRVGTNTSTTINVLPYAKPQFTFNVQRCNASGTPTNNGTYIRVVPNATASSLIVSGSQKNSLKYRVRTRELGTSTWTTAKSLTNTGGLSFNSPVIIGSNDYSVATSWEVEFYVEDSLGALSKSDQVLIVPTAFAIIHAKKDGTGIGLGKYHEGGFLDVGGDILQNGNPVIDASDHATTSERGIVELATDAETIDGTSTTLAVTPAGLEAARINSDTGWVDLSAYSISDIYLRGRRVGDLVSLGFTTTSSFSYTANTSLSIASGLPPEWRPTQSNMWGTAYTGSGAIGATWARTDGSVMIRFETGGSGWTPQGTIFFFI